MISLDTKKQMIEIGFAAAMRGWEKEAKAIFSAIRIICPENPAGFIGFALLALSKKQHEEAISTLQQGLQKDPGNPELEVFLGLAYHLEGEFARKNDVLKKISNVAGPVGVLARDLLEETKETGNDRYRSFTGWSHTGK